MIFFHESSVGYSNNYQFGKMYKTYHFVCFFNLLANVKILPRHFLSVSSAEWCLRSADALRLCNWPAFFWGGENFVDLETFKKKISEIGPCLLYFKNRRKFYFFGGRKRPVGTWWVRQMNSALPGPHKRSILIHVYLERKSKPLYIHQPRRAWFYYCTVHVV